MTAPLEVLRGLSDAMESAHDYLPVTALTIRAAIAAIEERDAEIEKARREVRRTASRLQRTHRNAARFADDAAKATARFKAAVKRALQDSEKIATLTRQLAEARDALFSVESTEAIDGGARATIRSVIFPMLAHEVAAWFKESGGVNFVEFWFSTNGPDGERFQVTVRRREGKAPSELLAEVRNQLAEAQADNAEALQTCTSLRSILSGIHGALVDVADLPMGAVGEDEATAVRHLAAQRDAMRGALREIAAASEYPEDHLFRDSFGDYADADMGNCDDVARSARREEAHRLSLIARRALGAL